MTIRYHIQKVLHCYYILNEIDGLEEVVPVSQYLV
jgi:hypothetical protein